MVMSYRHIRKEFVILTVLGLIVFSLTAIFLHHIPALIEHSLSAAMVGGISLGLGLGIVMRYGGALDILELAEHSLWRNGVPVSLDHIIMLINCMVLTMAGFVFGLDQAMYSVIAYLLAFEMVHLTIRGFSLYSTIYVQSSRYEKIQQVLSLRLGLTHISEDKLLDDGNMEQDESRPIMYKVHLAEKARFRALVKSIDPEASISCNTSTRATSYHLDRT